MSNKRYKCCFVPKCTSTTIATPNKIFLVVPKNKLMRRKWEIAAKRAHPLSMKTVAFCCEDHFNIKEDVENYLKYSLVGGNLKIKSTVVPSKFECQHRSISKPRSLPRKRFLEESSPPVELSTTNEEESALTPTPQETASQHFCVSQSTSKATQTKRRHYRSVSTGTSTSTADAKCSPLKKQTLNFGTSPLKYGGEYEPCSSKKSKFCENRSCCRGINFEAADGNEDVSDVDNNSEQSSDPSYVPSEVESDDESSMPPLQIRMYPQIRTIMAKNPKLYLGLEKNVYFLVDELALNIGTSVRNILICLRKIRLNEQNEILGDLFDLSSERIGQIFREFLPKIAYFCRPFVYWPDADVIKRNLPIAFRKNFSDVESIIDCLEIQIEKPSNPLHQTLTWSNYKKGNTLKYLISCTPDGTCNFISEGYAGRATDVAILKDCGYLDRLRPGTAVLADRGFKQVDKDIADRNCLLKRPPSTSAGKIFTAGEVKETKRIASVRIHVERVIGRLRNFKYLDPHARVSNKLAPLTDEVIVIACALVNLQSPIIDTRMEV